MEGVVGGIEQGCVIIIPRTIPVPVPATLPTTTTTTTTTTTATVPVPTTAAITTIPARARVTWDIRTETVGVRMAVT